MASFDSSTTIAPVPRPIAAVAISRPDLDSIRRGALYFQNYLLGFAVLFILSFKHVSPGFRLNHRLFRETGGYLRTKSWRAVPT